MTFTRNVNRFYGCCMKQPQNWWTRRFLTSSSVCTLKYWLFAAKTCALVSLYYLFSIGLTFYQKWFIKDFPFPLTVVLCHLVVKFLLSALIRCALKWYNDVERVTLSWQEYLRKLAIAGIASAMDIGLSNWSFRFITISLYTMSKSSCIVFILLFSVLLGLETLRVSLVFVVFLIASGLFMFTYSSTQFNVDGFIMVMLASIMAGLRWTVAQLVMQRKETGLSHPVDMMYHIQPWMIVGLLPLAIPFEGIELATSKLVFRYQDIDVLLTSVGHVLIGALLAFLMELGEYILLVHTSSLTLSISGILKEVFTLYLAVKVNGDTMTTINKIGFTCSIIGISLHVLTRTMRQDEKVEPSVEYSAIPLLESKMTGYISDSNSESDENTVYHVGERSKQ